MTLAEFLEFEGEGDTRYQLIDGRPVAMAPPFAFHGTIVANLCRCFGNRLHSPCRAITEAGIVLPDRDDRVFVADIAVTCAPIENSPRVRDPVLIAEVLSPSGSHADPLKMLDYTGLPTVRELLLVGSEQRVVKLWTRQGPGDWRIRDYIGDAEVPVQTIGGALSMAEIYRDTTL